MLRIFISGVLVVAAVAGSLPLAAQSTGSAERSQSERSLRFPPRGQYDHEGTIESYYDEDADSSTTSLNLELSSRAIREVFSAWTDVRGFSLMAGFTYPGRRLTSAPELVTVLLKVRTTIESARRLDARQATQLELEIDGSERRTYDAVIVARTPDKSDPRKARFVDDTYAVLIRGPAFLRLAQAESLRARFRNERMVFTKGMLEAVRDLASRMAPEPPLAPSRTIGRTQ